MSQSRAFRETSTSSSMSTPLHYLPELARETVDVACVRRLEAMAETGRSWVFDAVYYVLSRCGAVVDTYEHGAGYYIDPTITREEIAALAKVAHARENVTQTRT